MAAVGALAAGIISIPATPAHAADTIDYRGRSGVLLVLRPGPGACEGLHGRGSHHRDDRWSGGHSVPELKGANITVKTPCTINSSPAVETHGTGVASILVSADYGVAPKVSLLAYQGTFGADGDQGSSDCDDPSGVTKDSQPWLLNQAMNDGAQIINVSASTPNEYKELKWVTARAIAQQVIFVNAAGNSSRDDDDTSLSAWSGVVGVTAISVDGTRQDYSSWGQGVVTTSIGGPVLFRNIETGANDTVSATSVASPIVAGVLALAKQRWPQATSNQLLQLLVKTCLNPDHGWNKYTGFGGIDPGAILNTDPSQFPDENPLAQKQGGSSPTPEEVQQYAGGVVDPTDIVNDDSYTYRGFDESKLKDGLNVYPTHLGTSPRYHRK